MRRYETICIADPDASDENRISLFDKIKSLIAQEKGILVDFDEWGNRQLAYEIRKKTRGYYVCITYGGTGELVEELERNFRLDDRVLKFMTILLEKDVDSEKLQQEGKAEEASSEKASTALQDENTDKNTGTETGTEDSDIQPDQDDNGKESNGTKEEK